MWSVIKKTLLDFLDDDCPSLAASLAYYTMFSLAPVLVIVLTVCSLVLDPEDVRGQITSEVQSVVGKKGALQIEEMVTNLSVSKGATLNTTIGIVTLVFGATGVLSQLQRALNKVWEVTPDPQAGGVWNFITKRALSLAMVMGIAFVLLVSLTVSWMIKAAGERLVTYLPGETPHWIWAAGHEIVLVLVATVLFAAIFKFLPDAEIRWSNVLVGALITSVLFVAGKYGISVYLASSSVGEVYGAAGSLVLILVWVYYSAMILLLGAEFTQKWTVWRGHHIRPEGGAAKVKRKVVKVATTPVGE